jgi:hypothetical protein
VALVGKTTLLLSPELLTPLVLDNRILLLSALYRGLLEVVVLAVHLLVMAAAMVEIVLAPALVLMAAVGALVAIQVMVVMVEHNPAMLA